MYIPQHFREDRTAVLRDLADRRSAIRRLRSEGSLLGTEIAELMETALDGAPV